ATLALLPCAGGLDLAQKIDLASLVVVFRHRIASVLDVEVKTEAEDGAAVSQQMQLNYRITAVPFFWIPEETMRQREKDDGVPYSDWVRLGLVTPTDGFTIDYDQIYRDITTKIVKRFPRLKQGGIGYDPAFATDIASTLRDKAGFKVAEILQGYKYLNEPCHVLEALIKAKRVSHGAHRVLRNHIEHVAVKTDDAGRIRPVRPKKAGKHIDGVVGLLEGLAMLAGVPDRHQGTVGGFVINRRH
ncbi:MAG TPA: terminase TerL endonuclease subunit, partial [Vicinamibacterales bacterium]|nr:terminase TerL endonuclease subunit [Vicinamibacterales bacterium]